MSPITRVSVCCNVVGGHHMNCPDNLGADDAPDPADDDCEACEDAPRPKRAPGHTVCATCLEEASPNGAYFAVLAAVAAARERGDLTIARNLYPIARSLTPAAQRTSVGA